jgi:anti-sigma factor RsiW
VTTCGDYHAIIQLYVDGELTGEERDDLLSHVASCACCRDELREAEAFSRRIRAARHLVVAPDSLRATVLRKVQEAGAGRNELKLVPRNAPALARFPLVAAVAAVLLVAASSMFIFYQGRQRDAKAMIQAAVLAHDQLERNNLPLDISSESPQTVAAWFQGRLSFPFRMANSGIAADNRAKFKLKGGRLLTVNNEPVALLAFRVPDDLVSMLVGPRRLLNASGGTIIESGGIAMHSYDQGSLHIVTWNRQGLSYVLTFRNSAGDPHKCSSCHEDGGADKAATQAAADDANWLFR